MRLFERSVIRLSFGHSFSRVLKQPLMTNLWDPSHSWNFIFITNDWPIVVPVHIFRWRVVFNSIAPNRLVYPGNHDSQEFNHKPSWFQPLLCCQVDLKGAMERVASSCLPQSIVLFSHKPSSTVCTYSMSCSTFQSVSRAELFEFPKKEPSWLRRKMQIFPIQHWWICLNTQCRSNGKANE